MVRYTANRGAAEQRSRSRREHVDKVSAEAGQNTKKVGRNTKK